MRLRLFLGLLLVFLAFWKGDGGYLDLREYLDDAERIWLKGDLRLPAEEGAPAQYNRYSLGLPFLSGPLVLTGAAVQWVTQGAIGRRAVAGLTAPLLAALAGVLLFEIAVLLKSPARIGVFAAIVFCLGSPQLTYARFFYAETGIVCGILLAVWSYLKFLEDGRGWWALLVGTGLVAAGASHYPHGPLVACVWVCLAIGIAASGKTSRARSILLMALIPLLAGGCLIALNLSRYGRLVPPRYQVEVDAFIGPQYIAGNLGYVGRMLLRTIWFAPALVCGLALLWRSTFRHKPLACAMLVGIVTQVGFWLCYYQTNMFATRYLHSMSALAAIGLPGLLLWLENKLPGRGVTYAMLAFLVSNAAQFFGDTIHQPFMLAPDGGGVWMYAWYMQPIASGAKFDAGSPAGLLQFAVFGSLLLGGITLLKHASACAKTESPLT